MKHLSLSSLIGLLAAAGLATAAAVSEISPTPLNVTQSVKPRVLFVLSNDHALYYKAYTDWNDLTGDGKPDTTYVHTFKYYGYFDPTKCYDYVIAAGRFEPKAVTTDPNFYCDAVDGTWSGNFLNWATMSRMDIVRKVLYGGHRSTDTAAVTVLERAYIPSDAHSFAKYYEGTDSAKLTPFDTPKLTLCNTTYADSGESQNITTPPQIRVARGDFRYWAANERWQCTWDDERGDSSSGDNTTDSNTSDPNKNNDGLGEKNYSARVQVCVAGKIGAEECKRYPDGNYKPVGLLHTYGEDDQLLFGLLTGSYAKNKSGGMLRKNISAFSNEVNTKTDGTFTGAPGIVATLDRLRIARYQYGSGKGYYNETDSCPWALSLFDEGKCSNWGNPLSEMYLEALRYMAGLKATANFSATDDTYIEGLTSPDWTDPLDAKNWCAHCDVIVLNASEPSYDNDGMDSGGLSGSPSAADKTNAVGKHEGINNNDFFVGENGTDKNQLCTGKKVPALGDVRGACPGAPRLSGTYYAAGLAHWAHTNDIRFDLIGEQTVTTRAVTLSPAAPKLVIPVPGGGKRTVSILPACRNLTPNPDGNCAIVDFKIIDQDVAAGTGEVYVNWEDSEQGGDYDQDMKGTLSYAINSNTTVTVTTKVDRKSTPHQLGFGYVIGGTTQDGFHVHTGINNFKYTDPSGVTGCTACDPCSNGKTESPVCPSPTGACSECNVTIPATSVTYTLGDSTAGLLEEPMWYAAKYGSFIDSITKDKFPDQDPDQDQQAEWDADGDKRPDGFFFASNPTELGPSLARFLDIISTTSSAAAVAANSARLNSDTRIYQARYDTENWTGDLIAFPINSDGTLDKAAWHAQDQIGIQAKAGTRRILTTNEDTGDGVPFRWSESNTTGIATAQISALNGACATCIPDGPIRLNYLRGSQANEISQPNGTLRTRDALLGDIVNSEPVYVGPPADYFPKDLEEHSYRDFANTHVGRAPVLYVGANDGMLHAFMADTGAELFAYVPRALYPKLAALTMLAYQTNHQFYVDLGPTVTDAYLGASKQWRSVLVAGLGAGGAGIFAIDVTDPAAFEGDEEKAGLQVLWDIVGGDTGFEQLGYTFSKPAVVRLPGNNHNGVWAAVFGNGYESINGQAVLYLVNAATGERLEEVIADTGPGNGLSSVAPIDYDGDAKVDYIYAGDLQGRLWRFEPTTAGGWKVSFDGKPLFTNEATIESIRTYQPITVRPEVVRHRRGGVLVLFGTGSYYRTADRKPNTDQTKVNAFYGIWDRLDGTNDIRTTHLLQQQILAEQTVGNYEVRVTSDNAILWHKTSGKPQGTPPTTHLGWSLKLVDPIAGALGEIQVTNPLARDGRIIFTTMIPSDVACDFGGKGWLMELDLFNGKPVDDVLFDLNGDGVFDTADMVTIQRGDHSVLMSPTGIGPPPDVPTMMARPTVIGAGFREFKYVSETKDAGVGKITEKPANPKGGRRSWLQVH